MVLQLQPEEWADEIVKQLKPEFELDPLVVFSILVDCFIGLSGSCTFVAEVSPGVYVISDDDVETFGEYVAEEIIDEYLPYWEDDMPAQSEVSDKVTTSLSCALKVVTGFTDDLGKSYIQGNPLGQP